MAFEFDKLIVPGVWGAVSAGAQAYTDQTIAAGKAPGTTTLKGKVLTYLPTIVDVGGFVAVVGMDMAKVRLLKGKQMDEAYTATATTAARAVVLLAAHSFTKTKSSASTAAMMGAFEMAHRNPQVTSAASLGDQLSAQQIASLSRTQAQIQ